MLCQSPTLSFILILHQRITENKCKTTRLWLKINLQNQHQPLYKEITLLFEYLLCYFEEFVFCTLRWEQNTQQ